MHKKLSRFDTGDDVLLGGDIRPQLSQASATTSLGNSAIQGNAVTSHSHSNGLEGPSNDSPYWNNEDREGHSQMELQNIGGKSQVDNTTELIESFPDGNIADN